jgi:hypothetical protein
LFLTDLKGYDVVLGKLAATSVTGLYALLAVFPVLGVPLLTGGMTSGEVGRMIVVLTNTFFFSISAGIFASAISRDYRTAMAANFSLWLALVCAPTALGIGLGIAVSRHIWPLFYSCPIFSFYMSADAMYAARPDNYWWSIVVTDGLAWVLVVLACRIVPRTWGDKPERAEARRWRWRDLGRLITYGNADRRAAFRKEALDRNAYFWHAARARLKPAHVWLFLGLSGAWWIWCWVDNGPIWLDVVTFVATSVFLNSTFKLWITLEAGQRLGEDRRSGAFELLLATPLTVADILRGQLLALRRQFFKPLVVVIVLESVFIAVLRGRHKIETLEVTAELLVLPTDIAALICVAMSAALRSKSQTQATVMTVSRILILPWIIVGAIHGLGVALYWLNLMTWEPSERAEIAEWLWISVAVDLIYGLPAWWSLRQHFRRLATQRPTPMEWRALWRWTFARVGGLAGRIVPPRLRIAAVAVVGAAVTLGVVHYARPRHSDARPPVDVSITQSNAPLSIILGGGGGVFLILPDGTLWRWGATGAPLTARAAMPEQVGTNHDWLKADSEGPRCLGLRGDGTVWELGLSNGTNLMMPRPAIDGSNWADIGAGRQSTIGLMRDGTIWEWDGVLPTATRPVRVGMGSNWAAVCCRDSSYIGLRADGTLWAWGAIRGTRNGSSWFNTNIDEPARLCAETNWISLDGNGQARNRAGELWYAGSSLPEPDASVATVCRRITSRRVMYRVDTGQNWMRCEIRSDGTLWTTTMTGWNALTASSAAGSEIGTRSDWVALWGFDGTAFGLTGDGILWAWGVDLGCEPVASVRTRIRLVQSLFNGQARSAGGWWPGSLPPPILEEPMPLMKLDWSKGSAGPPESSTTPEIK